MHNFCVKCKQEVVCALLNGDIAGDLGWPWPPKHPNFYILHCLLYLRSGWTL